MVEIPANKHDEFTKALHGLVESGESFKTTNIYIKQYNNSRNNYRKMRAREHLEGNKKMNHKIISIITTYEKDGDFMGGVNECTIREAAQMLNIKFPNSYHWF